MAEKTAISWCDHTWSPVWGCTQVSKAKTGGGGCDNCYAMALAHRFGYGWNGEPMREFGEKHWQQPLRWNERAKKSGARPRVFPSMCDPFDKNWPDGVREKFFRLIEETPHLTWLLLTKRIGNAAEMMFLARGGHLPILPNVWIGATVVNQAEADRDIPKLLAVPARVRFLSIEPMLGAINLCRCWLDPYAECGPGCRCPRAGDRLHWVICGGESGPKARPMHPDWARSLAEQCRTAGISFFMKQMGGHPSKRDDMREFPVELQRQEFPT